MVVGAINQTLYLRALPEGLTFTILEERPIKPAEGGWRPYVMNQKAVPYVVKASNGDGWGDGRLGEYQLTGAIGDSGSGSSFHITFKIEGTTSGVSISQKGYITIATDDWEITARPDYTNVTYQFEGTQPANLTNKTPTLQTPDNVSLLIVFNPKDKKLGMTATTDKNIVGNLIGYALEGIFFAHKKAAGWIVGL